MSNKREVRTADVKIKDTGTYFGTPVVYGSRSEPICGFFIEEFRAGAFDKWLDTNPDVYACVNHESGKVLGRTSSGTLRLARTANGIDIEGDLPNTTYGNDLREQLNRKDIRGMSFIFECLKDEWREVKEKDKPTQYFRDVIEARLYEVSFVTNPAYPATMAGIRSADEMRALVPTRTFPKRSVWTARVRINEKT